MKISLISVLAFVGSAVSAFKPASLHNGNRVGTALQGSRKDSNDELFKPATILAAFIISNVAMVAPAFAEFGDSSIMLSGRSGGRAGGRAVSASRPAPARVVERQTTIIQATPSYGYGSPMMMAPSYNPMPGLGLSLGLNAIGSIGNEIRDYNQEREIAQSRRELAETKAREQMLEQRMQMLEMQNMQQRQVVPQPAN